MDIIELPRRTTVKTKADPTYTMKTITIDHSEFRSVADVVYEQLKEAILLSKLEPGQRLSERNLADQLNISTTPIKRAFHKLYIEGLIDIQPRKGTFVSNFTLSNITENSILRAHLEGLAARFAAEKATAEDVDRLRDQLEKMKKHTSTSNTSKMIESNTDFHRIIHDISRNQYIKQLIQILRSFDRIIRKRALIDHEEAERGFKEHKGVFEAIAKHDGELAEKRIREHILRTSRFVISEIRKARP